MTRTPMQEGERGREKEGGRKRESTSRSNIVHDEVTNERWHPMPFVLRIAGLA